MEFVRACGVVTELRTKMDKAGRNMAFFTVDDFTGSCECLMFAKNYAECEEHIEQEATVVVIGKLESSGDAIKLHAEEVIPLSKAKYKLTKKLALYMDENIHGEKIVRDLRKLGAKKIYLALTCPAIRFACYYGIDFPTDDELIASGYKIDEIKNTLDVDELFYQKIESLKKAIGFSDLCTACLSGSYPTAYAQEIRIKYLNGELKNRSHYEEV